MRNEFIPFVTREEAEEKMPLASVIIHVFGGYKGFESLYDYEVWKNQK